MKKSYSDPLMFSNVLLSGITIGPSQQGGFGPGGPAKAPSLKTAAPALSTTSDTEDVLSSDGNDIQIVDPSNTAENIINENEIKAVIEEIVPAESTENPVENTSDIAE